MKPSSPDDQESANTRRRFGDDVLSDDMAAMLCAMGPAKRLQMALQSWTFLRDLIHRAAARQHPEWSQEELDRHVAERMSRGTG